MATMFDISYGSPEACMACGKPYQPNHETMSMMPNCHCKVETGRIVAATPPSALDVQVGGDHYKKLKIQPMEYAMANGLDACQATAIKYITRFRDKGGVKDLEKAKHCIDMLIHFEGKKDEQPS